MDKGKVWDLEESLLLFSNHNRLGNKWSMIAENMKGRTDNCVKNHFYGLIRKGVKRANQYLDIHRKKTKHPTRMTINENQVKKVLGILE